MSSKPDASLHGELESLSGFSHRLVEMAVAKHQEGLTGNRSRQGVVFKTTNEFFRRNLDLGYGLIELNSAKLVPHIDTQGVESVDQRSELALSEGISLVPSIVNGGRNNLADQHVGEPLVSPEYLFEARGERLALRVTSQVVSNPALSEDRCERNRRLGACLKR